MCCQGFISLLSILLIVLNLIHNTSCKFSCLNEDNKPVDWWVIYKYPRIKNNLHAQSGFAYEYSDSHQGLAISPHNLKDESSALWKTLNQFYGTPNIGGHLMWNDQPPLNNRHKKRYGSGHAKGIIAFDSESGFLIRHSIPKYPNPLAQGLAGLSQGQSIFGQLLLCLSVDLSTLDKIAYQYTIISATVYDAYIPSEQYKVLPNIVRLQKGQFVKKSSNTFEFQTLGGQRMVDIAKAKSCRCELWDTVIPNQIKDGFNVLSWGRPLQKSICPPNVVYPIQNILQIAWLNGIKYDEPHEHSKWGLALSTDILCIGDCNRMDSQRHSGGGATCISHPLLVESFRNLIGGLQGCKIEIKNNEKD